MLTFHRIVEQMEKESGMTDTAGLRIIRAGVNASPDFWKQFMSLTADSDAMAELLNVPREKITQWNSRIQSGLDTIRLHDDQESKSTKSHGINAVADPLGAEAPKNGTAETRPTP